MAATDSPAPSDISAEDAWIISVALREFADTNTEAAYGAETAADKSELRRQAHRALALASDFETRQPAAS